MTAPALPSSDEEKRKLLKPNVLPCDVLRTLTTFFSKSPSSTFKVVKALDSYDDQNFLVEIDSSKYLLKIHNGVESDNSVIINFQNSIMVHLNETDGVVTSNPLSPSSSEALAEDGLSVKVPLPVASAPHSPYHLAVRLLTYIEGTPMAYKAVTPQLLSSAGK